MKLHKSLLLAPVALLSLSSCALSGHRYKIEEYFIDYTQAKDSKEVVGENAEFNILQLSDIHMGMMDDAKTHYKFIKKTIDQAKKITNNNLHLIVITGDVFTFASKDTVKELCNFFEAQETPWTLTFGNHDEQGYFSINWLTDYLNSLSARDNTNLLFRDLRNDDVFGNANFAINLPYFDTTSEHIGRQIIMMDSNRYNYGEYFGYDSIHVDQIDWYSRIANYATTSLGPTVSNKNSSHKATSLVFFHIPVPEYLDAYNDAIAEKDNSKFLTSTVHTCKGGDNWDTTYEYIRKDHKDTSEGSPKVNTGFFETARTTDSTFGSTGDDSYTKGMFVGHAHTNTNCMDYYPSDVPVEEGEEQEPNGIALCYGIKSTDRVYYNNDMLGGQLIRYYAKPRDGAKSERGSSWFNLELIYHKYVDLKEGE